MDPSSSQLTEIESFLTSGLDEMARSASQMSNFNAHGAALYFKRLVGENERLCKD